MLKRITITVSLLGLALYYIATQTALPEAPVPGSTTALMLEAGPYPVIEEKRKLVDMSRDVPDPNVDGQTLPRSFQLSLWRPEGLPAGQRMPLVFYSHGVMSSAAEGAHIGKHLASHGYLVAGPDFPLTGYASGEDVNPADVVNQPADVSYALDELLRESTDTNSPLYQRIDNSRIAAIGMSLGGMTTHMLGYDPLRREPRLALTIAVGAPSAMFTEKYFSTSDKPYMMIASDQDAFIGYAENALPILDKVANATLVTLAGGSHAGFSDQARWLRWLDNPDSIGCSQVAGSIDTEAQDDGWFSRLGSIEHGYIEVVDMDVCESELQPAINPIRQTQLELLAAWSFLQCHFARQGERDRACQFLKEGIASENAELSISDNFE